MHEKIKMSAVYFTSFLLNFQTSLCFNILLLMLHILHSKQVVNEESWFVLKPALWNTIKGPRVLAFEHSHIKNQHPEVAAFL